MLSGGCDDYHQFFVFGIQVIVLVALLEYSRSFLFDEVLCARSWEMVKAAGKWL